jgi:hypothetical protein
MIVLVESVKTRAIFIAWTVRITSVTDLPKLLRAAADRTVAVLKVASSPAASAPDVNSYGHEQQSDAQEGGGEEPVLVRPDAVPDDADEPQEAMLGESISESVCELG